MKWVAISGSWKRGSTPEVEADVRSVAREILDRGDGIVSGGALGVDFIATNEALRHGAEARVKVFLPSTLERYAAHYRQRADEGVIASSQAEALIAQLEDVRRRDASALVENLAGAEINKETYFARNAQIIDAADELIAFHVVADDTSGEGTLDAIAKAKERGKPTRVFAYDLRTM